jgi:hypothetical protein
MVMWTRRLAAAALAAAVALGLGGCIGVETTYVFQADGSGTATLVYKVSQLVTQIGTGQGEEGGVPLPLTEADFTRAVSEAPGVSLTGGVKRTEDEENITIAAALRFDRVESLAKVRGFGDSPATLTQDGDRWVFRQVVSSGGKPGEQVDTDTMKIVEQMFAGYDVTFVVQAPAEIRSATLGTISGKTLKYSVSIPDLLKTTQPVQLEVVW